MRPLDAWSEPHHIRFTFGINTDLPLSNPSSQVLPLHPSSLFIPTNFNDNVRQENRSRRHPRRLGLRSGYLLHRDLFQFFPELEFVSLSSQLRSELQPVHLVGHPSSLGTDF